MESTYKIFVGNSLPIQTYLFNVLHIPSTINTSMDEASPTSNTTKIDPIFPSIVGFCTLEAKSLPEFSIIVFPLRSLVHHSNIPEDSICLVLKIKNGGTVPLKLNTVYDLKNISLPKCITALSFPKSAAKPF